MKNFYKISLLLLPVCVFAAPINGSPKNSSLEKNEKTVPPSLLVNDYHPVVLTGFNKDVVANGAGEANTTTDSTIDFSNVLYSADFVPTTPYGGIATAASYGGGLPADGVVTSYTTSGVTYNLADYSAANVLLLRPLTTNTGTLTFGTTYTATSLYILWVGTEGQSNAGVTINFSDGTTQAATNQAAYDWVSGTSNIGLNSLARVGNGSTMWAANNQFSESGSVKLFEKHLTILAANQSKEITGVTFNYTGTGDYQSLAVFAITVFGEELGVNQNALAQFSVYPNPTTGVVKVNSSAAVKQLEVFNELGQSVAKNMATEISIADFNPGIYYLKITLEGDVVKTQKIVKQ